MTGAATYLDEKLSYSREVDEAGLPTEKIEAQNTFHHMDAERYILAHLHERSEPFPLPEILAPPSVRASIYERARGYGYGEQDQTGAHYGPPPPPRPTTRGHGLFGRR